MIESFYSRTTTARTDSLSPTPESLLGNICILHIPVSHIFTAHLRLTTGLLCQRKMSYPLIFVTALDSSALINFPIEMELLFNKLTSGLPKI